MRLITVRKRLTKRLPTIRNRSTNSQKLILRGIVFLFALIFRAAIQGSALRIGVLLPPLSLLKLSVTVIWSSNNGNGSEFSVSNLLNPFRYIWLLYNTKIQEDAADTKPESLYSSHQCFSPMQPFDGPKIDEARNFVTQTCKYKNLY